MSRILPRNHSSCGLLTENETMKKSGAEFRPWYSCVDTHASSRIADHLARSFRQRLIEARHFERVAVLKALQPPKPVVTSDYGPFWLWNEEILVVQPSIDQAIRRSIWKKHGSCPPQRALSLSCCKSVVPVAPAVVHMFSEIVRDLIVV